MGPTVVFRHSARSIAIATFKRSFSSRSAALGPKKKGKTNNVSEETRLLGRPSNNLKVTVKMKN
jgi:hypothetical protein